MLASADTRKPWGLASIGFFTLLVFITGASIVWAIDPAVAWLETNRSFALLAAFLIGAALVRLAPGQWRSLLGGLLIASFAISLYALLTKVFPAALAENETYGRLREPFGYWNAVGLTAALGLPAAAWLGARREGHATQLRAQRPAALAAAAATSSEKVCISTPCVFLCTPQLRYQI